MLVLQPAGDARLTFFSLQTDCLSRAVIPTHVSLRTPASLSTKMVCVAVRYRVPTRLLLWEILSSSLTFSTWKGEEEGQHQNSLIFCTSHACLTQLHICVRWQRNTSSKQWLYCQRGEHSSTRPLDWDRCLSYLFDFRFDLRVRMTLCCWSASGGTVRKCSKSLQPDLRLPLAVGCAPSAAKLPATAKLPALEHVHNSVIKGVKLAHKVGAVRQ